MAGMPPPPGFIRENYLTPDEVAGLWGVSGEFVRKLCRDNQIAGVLHFATRPGGRLRWFIPRAFAETYPQQAKS